jgi:predicted MFS family arabinose efflux permease
VGNLGAGSLTDRLGSRAVVNLAVVLLAINSALLRGSSAYFATGLVAIAVSGVSGWAIMVPQQHRLIALLPGSAPLVIALNASALYLGVALSGPIGAAGIGLVGAHQLGLLTTGFLILGLLASEVAHRFSRPGKTQVVAAPTSAANAASGVMAKAEEVGAPTGGEVAPAHREDSIDQCGPAR